MALFLSFAPVAIKKHNWWEDGRGPYLRTSAWIPHRRYSPDVEEALTVLQGVDAAEVLYLRSPGNPIIFVSGIQGRAGDTTPLGVIELPERFRGKPAHSVGRGLASALAPVSGPVGGLHLAQD
jgi:hypothetical protein